MGRNIDTPEYVSPVSQHSADVNRPEKVKKPSSIDEHIENIKKSDAAKLLVKKARFLVNDVENQMDSCRVLFEKDLKEYEEAKKSLHENGLDACEFLLSQLCYIPDAKTELDRDMVVFEPKGNDESLQIEELSSGKLTGMLLSVVVGLFAFAAVVFLGIHQLEINDLSNVPVGELVIPILNWYASFIGLDDRPMLSGGLLLALLALLMWKTYTGYVAFKENRNLELAKEQLKSAEFYCDRKVSCQEQMKRLDSFIAKAIETLALYQDVLTEQQERLKAILHAERENVASANFEPQSVRVMQLTQQLINYIKDFMAVPMSDEGKLSAKSGLYLLRAQNRIEKVIKRRKQSLRKSA